MAMRQDASTGEMVEAPEAAEDKKAAASKGPTMQVKVYAPFKIYFEGEATSVTALNETGVFDVLPHHHNFISMLLPYDLVVRTPYGQDETIKISRGLMHVKSEKVTVFLDV